MTIKFRKNIFNSIDLPLMLLLFPLLGSEVLAYIDIPYLSDGLRVVDILMIFAIFFFHNKFSKIIIPIFIFSIYYFFNWFYNNFFHHNNSGFFQGKGLLLILLTNLSLCLIIDVYIVSGKSLVTLFKTLAVLAFALCIINYIVVPDIAQLSSMSDTLSSGYGRSSWIFGHRNSIYNILLLSILFAGLCSILQHNRIKFFVFIVLGFAFFNEIVAWSAASLVGVLVVLIFFVFYRNLKSINIVHYVVILAITYISIVFFRLQEIFSPFIVGVLHRDLTFTGRTYVWNYAISKFLQKPFWGHGTYSVVESTLIFSDTTFRYFHAHNFFLGILYDVGIVGTIIFAVAFVMTCKKLYITKRALTSQIIAILIFSFILIGMGEILYDGILLLPLLVIGYHAQDLVDFQKKKVDS